MNQLLDRIESIEKSVKYLKEKYPADLPLLVSLEGQLAQMMSKKRSLNKMVTDSKKLSEELNGIE